MDVTLNALQQRQKNWLPRESFISRKDHDGRGSLKMINIRFSDIRSDIAKNSANSLFYFTKATFSLTRGKVLAPFRFHGSPLSNFFTAASSCKFENW